MCMYRDILFDFLTETQCSELTVQRPKYAQNMHVPRSIKCDTGNFDTAFVFFSDRFPVQNH